MKEILYKNNSFEIYSEKGFKGINDKVIQLNSNSHKVKVEDLLWGLKFIFKNEDTIHPTTEGFDGSRWMKQMVLRLLEGEEPSKIDKEYNQKGKYPGDAKLFDGSKWERVVCDGCLNHLYCEKCKKYTWRRINEKP